MTGNTFTSKTWKIACALAAGMMISGAASAAEITVDMVAGSWSIGSSGSTTDPDGREIIPAGQWNKTLLAPVATDPNEQRQLNEWLALDKNLSLSSQILTKWTEEVTTFGWVWFDTPTVVDVFIYDGDLLSTQEQYNFDGEGTTLISALINMSAQLDAMLLFTEAEREAFWALPDSVVLVSIQKELQCTDPDTCDGPMVSVVENATVPVPGTLLLLGAGLAGFGLRRRKA